MNLVSFLNNLFKYDGFVLVDSNSKKFVIGKPLKDNPIKIKLLDKSLNYKLLLNPDLYFGEAYTNGSLIIENGTLTEFLEIAQRNIGRNEININTSNPEFLDWKWIDLDLITDVVVDFKHHVYKEIKEKVKKLIN